MPNRWRTGKVTNVLPGCREMAAGKLLLA